MSWFSANFNELKNFALNGNFKDRREFMFNEKVIFVSKFTLFGFVLTFSILLIRGVLTGLEVIEVGSSSGNGPLDSFPDFSSLVKILEIIILGPIIEEIALRKPLVLTRLNLSIGLAIIIALLFRRIFFLDQYIGLTYFNGMITIFLLSVSIFPFLYVSMKQFKLTSLRSNMGKYNLPIVLFISAIIFSLMHINEFRLERGVADMSLLLLNYFVSAYIFSLVRMSLSTSWAIISHSLINTIDIIITIVL